MGIGDRLKNLLNVSEEEYADAYDIDEEETVEEDYSKDVRSSGFSFNRSRTENEGKVVDMRTSVPAAAQASNKTKIVFRKLEQLEDVASVADSINEKKIVVLNLETCHDEVSIRIIDFLNGVSYANNGDMRRIAGRVYIITPYNVPLTGELLDGIEQSF